MQEMEQLSTYYSHLHSHLFLKVTQKLHKGYTVFSLTVTHRSVIMNMLITVSGAKVPLS